MVFSTPLFLFYYLPLVLLFYYLTPVCFRNFILLLASLFFYYWGEQNYTLIMLLSIGIDYTHGLIVHRCKLKGNDTGARLPSLSPSFSIWQFCSSSSTGILLPNLCRQQVWIGCPF